MRPQVPVVERTRVSGIPAVFTVEEPQPKLCGIGVQLAGAYDPEKLAHDIIDVKRRLKKTSNLVMDLMFINFQVKLKNCHAHTSTV